MLPTRIVRPPAGHRPESGRLTTGVTCECIVQARGLIDNVATPEAEAALGVDRGNPATEGIVLCPALVRDLTFDLRGSFRFSL